MKPLILFHANCMDGAGSALAAWLRFGEEAEYRPVSYGDPAPTADEMRGGREVYILDFSYSREILVNLARNVYDRANFDGKYESPYAGKLVVLDHHVSAQRDLAGLPFCTFDMTKSGAVLAWGYFHGGYVDSMAGLYDDLPELFAYIQDRDLWRWELPHSREVSAALAARGCAEDWRKLIPIYEGWQGIKGNGHSFGSLVSEGAAILRAQEQQVARVVATAEEVLIEYSYRGRDYDDKLATIRGEVYALAASCPLLQSEIGEALALESARRGRDAVGVVYYRDGKVGKWRVSLRSRDVEETDEQLKARVEATLRERGLHSREEIVRVRTNAPDVSAIAKNFGGGGHAKAAGFECKELPWL